MVKTANEIWKNNIDSGPNAGQPHKPDKADIREWGTALEAATAGAAVSVTRWGAQPITLPTMGGATFTATANGTNVIAISALNGNLANGMRVCSVNWHSLGGAAITPRKITGISGSNITLDGTVAAGSGLKLVAWAPLEAAYFAGKFDSTAAFQNAIDWCLQNNVSELHVPDGNFLVSDTLQMGYGNGFRHITLVGGWRAGYALGGAGTHIISVVTDRPAINFQATRMSGMRGIALWGPNRWYVEYAQLGAHALSSDPLDWLAPNLAASGSTPGGLQPNSPLAGVTMDAFSGAAPAAPYSRTLPGWTGISDTYNAGYSSDLTIEECSVGGFGVQIINGVNSDAQQDFMRVRGGQILCGPYGVAACANQSRNVELRNVNGNGLHTVITNRNFGTVYPGVLAGPIDNVSVAGVYQFVDVLLQNPVILTQCYAESIRRIGRGQGGGYATPLALFGCGFDTQYNPGIIHSYAEPTLFESVNSAHLLVGDGTTITAGGVTNLSWCATSPARVTLRNCSLQGAGQLTSASAEVQAVINYSGGLLAGAAVCSYNYPALTVEGVVMAQTWEGGFYGQQAPMVEEISLEQGAVTPLKMSIKRVRDTTNRVWNIQTPLPVFADLSDTTNYVVALPTASGATWSMGWKAYGNGGLHDLRPGQIIVDKTTGTIAVIKTVGAPSGGSKAVTFEQLNNYVVAVGGGFASSMATGLFQGEIYILPPPMKLPAYVLFGTFTASNATVASVALPNGYGGNISTLYPAGTVFIGPPSAGGADNGSPLAAGLFTVSTPNNGSPGSIVLSAAGAVAVSGRFPVYPLPIH